MDATAARIARREARLAAMRRHPAFAGGANPAAAAVVAEEEAIVRAARILS